MRYFLLCMLLFFVSGTVFCQKKPCPFPYKSITKPDSVETLQLVKTIDTMKLMSYYEVEKIPQFILNTLKCWVNGEWRIARPGGNYNEGCIVVDSLPSRQLLYVGLNEHYMLLAYNQGGGFFSNTAVMLFRFENKKIKSVKYWYCRNHEAKTKADVIRSLQCLEFYIIATI